MRPPNRHANSSELADKIGDHHIPRDWWSRRFEYPWASQFAGPEFVVLDAACGINHPFKFFLADTCSSTHACDSLPNILRVNYPKLITHLHDITKPMKMSDDHFDRIFCISSIEHISPKKSIEDVLSDFARMLKPDGIVTVTFDLPDISVEEFLSFSSNAGLSPVGEVEREEPEDILIDPHHRFDPKMPRSEKRRVFCCALNHTP